MPWCTCTATTASTGTSSVRGRGPCRWARRELTDSRRSAPAARTRSASVAGNVLVGKDGAAKLADFGVSTTLVAGKKEVTSFAGTPHFMAPEVIQRQPYGTKVGRRAAHAASGGGLVS